MAKCEQRPRRFVGQRQFWAEPATQCHLEKIWPATNSTMAAWPKTLLYTILNLDLKDSVKEKMETKYWSKKGSYPPIANHPHHDGLDSLFYLSCFTGEGMDHPAGANTSTEYLTFAHPSSNSLHSIYQYSPPDSISSLFYAFFPTIDHCLTISSMFYVFM